MLLMRKRRGLVARVAAAGLSWIGLLSTAHADDSLLPDMQFQVDCSENPRPDFDDQVTRYLTDQGFRVVDIGKSHVDRSTDADGHELRGIDRRNRIVSLVSFPRRPNHLSFTLLSMPPTRHNEAFDSAIQNFFSRDLICDVSQVAIHENNGDSLASFQAEVDRLNALLQRAEGMDASSSPH